MLASVSPIVAGLREIFTPAAWRAANLASAVPLPPLMIAPAWPMRFPGGALAPAMKAATGFFTWALIYSAARSSAPPPISPMRMRPWVFGSALNIETTSTKSMPLTGSPPMPTQVD